MKSLCPYVDLYKSICVRDFQFMVPLSKDQENLYANCSILLDNLKSSITVVRLGHR